MIPRIDPEGRPLFVGFLVDALTQGKDPYSWDQEALLQTVLAHEEDRWQAINSSDGERNALAFATMAGGIPLAELAAANAPEVFRAIQPFNPERYRLMSGRRATHELAPLEPDILGELFVLEQTRPAHAFDRERGAKLSRLAWKHDPAQMFSFLDRTAHDFPRHPSFRVLMDPVDDDERTRFFWSMAAANTCFYLGNAGQIADAMAIYQALRDFAGRFPSEPALRARPGKTAANLIISAFPDIEVSQQLYHDLAALVDAHPREPDVLDAYARGARNMIGCYIAPPGARPININGVLTLMKDPRSRNEQVMPEVLDARLTEEYLAKARRVYDSLIAVAAVHPLPPGARADQARACCNLLSRYSDPDVQRIEGAREMYWALVALAAAHAEDRFLREEQAKGAVKLILAICRDERGDATLAQSLYEDVAELVTQHPAEPELRRQLVMGSLNLIP